MAQYTASVAIHDELRLVALTAPRGNRFFIWDLDSGAVRLDAPLPDCAGVGAVKDGFVVTSGQGRCRFYDCRKATIAAAPCSCPPGSGTTTCTSPDTCISSPRPQRTVAAADSSPANPFLPRP